MLMVVDAISDLYFSAQLFTSPLYDKLELNWKYTYVILCSVGMLGWMTMAGYKAAKVTYCYGWH